MKSRSLCESVEREREREGGGGGSVREKEAFISQYIHSSIK